MLLHRSKILTKDSLKVNYKHIIIGFIFILILGASYGLGFITGAHIINRPPLIIDKQLIIPTLPDTTTKPNSYLFVASKKGKYYYPTDCPLAQRLSQNNKVYFQTKQEAEAKGYQLNQKCQ